jgi:hypothetical protein
MIIGSGDISRVDDSPSATTDNGNAVRLNYPMGCEGETSVSCATTDVADQSELGALQQLQTSINTVHGNDLFLSVRIRVVNMRHIQLVLYPHSAADASYFELTTPEIVGYFVFSVFNVICTENMVFETAIHEGVTSVAIHVPFEYSFTHTPGIFGTLGTAISLTDATTLRSFGSTRSGSNFITQEDQCDTEQTDHPTPERVFTLVVGEVAGSASNSRCKVEFNSAASTPAPSSSPSYEPSISPTITPTSSPSTAPTFYPSAAPTCRPTLTPSEKETAMPTGDCNAAEFNVKFTKKKKTNT